MSDHSLTDQSTSESTDALPASPSNTSNKTTEKDPLLSLQDNVRTLLEFKLSLLRSQKECQKIIEEMKALRSNLISAKIKRIE